MEQGKDSFNFYVKCALQTFFLLRVQLGKLKEFIKTSCLTNLTFLNNREGKKKQITII